MSDIQSISQGNYILQGTVATSAGIVGDGSTQNPLRADETVLWDNGNLTIGSTAILSETVKNFKLFGIYGHESNRGRGVYKEFNPAVIENDNTQNFALFLPDCASDFSWAGWYIENLHFTDTAATALANVSGRQTWRWYANNTWEDDSSNRHILVDKIIGINRINNA